MPTTTFWSNVVVCIECCPNGNVGSSRYVRTLEGQAIPVLGLLDKVTGFHMAAILQSRDADVVVQTIRQMWLKPFGLPSS